jgi:hypothetical protein
VRRTRHGEFVGGDMRPHAKLLGFGSALIGLALAGSTSVSAATTRPGVATTAKPPGYSIVTATFDLPTGVQTAGFVVCPIKKGVRTVPLTGGALLDTGSLKANINTSYPTSGGWEVFANNASGAASTFIVYAVCMTKPKGYVQQESATVPNPADSQNGAGYMCPKGDELLGGGEESSSQSTLVNVNSAWPAGTTTWYMYMNNSSSVAASVILYRVCAKLNVSKIHYQLATSATIVNPAFTETAISVACPTGLSTISGGLLTGAGAGLGVTLNSSFPLTGGWEGDENNATATGVNLTAYALCAS